MDQLEERILQTDQLKNTSKRSQHRVDYILLCLLKSDTNDTMDHYILVVFTNVKQRWYDHCVALDLFALQTPTCLTIAPTHSIKHVGMNKSYIRNVLEHVGICDMNKFTMSLVGRYTLLYRVSRYIQKHNCSLSSFHREFKPDQNIRTN